MPALIAPLRSCLREQTERSLQALRTELEDIEAEALERRQKVHPLLNRCFFCLFLFLFRISSAVKTLQAHAIHFINRLVSTEEQGSGHFRGLCMHTFDVK